MKYLKQTDPEIYDAILGERRRQETHLELIASENFTSRAVLEAAGTILTNKYAEGYPGRRYYGGCDFVDRVEQLAIDRAKALFNADHANVQPHSGSQANIAVYTAVLRPGDKILTMSLTHGGHLSHGYEKNLSGMLYRVYHYETSIETGRIDYDQIEEIAERERVKLVTVGASAYPRQIDFKRVADIAHRTGALVMADIAHISGLVAAGLHPSPVPHCDFVTMTTHKTLRGPRGGLILCKKEFARAIDSALFPGTQGGPLMHIIAAKAVCFAEALQPAFRTYQQLVIDNAKALAQTLFDRGFKLVSDGTDNHLLLVDLRQNFPNMTGKTAQTILEAANITTNRNTVPGETRSPFQTSGLRLGTAAVSTRKMGIDEMTLIGELIDDLLRSNDDEKKINEIKNKVLNLCGKFPLNYCTYEE